MSLRLNHSSHSFDFILCGLSSVGIFGLEVKERLSLRCLSCCYAGCGCVGVNVAINVWMVMWFVAILVISISFLYPHVLCLCRFVGVVRGIIN